MSNNVYDNQDSYETFRVTYERQHPASVPRLESEGSPYPRWLKFATFSMFLAAALLSATHTIPVVFESIPESPVISATVRTIAANGSVIAFELGLLLSAFLMVSKSSLKLAWILLSTMFLGTLIANIYSISQTGTADVGAIAVTIIFGAGIPIIALSAGKLYVNIYTTEAAIERRAKETFRDAQKQWDSEIALAFETYLKKRPKSRVSSTMSDSLFMSDTLAVSNRHLDSDRHQTIRQSLPQTYTRVASAVETCLEYLRQHPEAANIPVRQLGELAQVGKDSAAKAQKLYLAEIALSEQSSNGHLES